VRCQGHHSINFRNMMRSVVPAFLLHFLLIVIAIFMGQPLATTYLRLTHTPFDSVLQWDAQWYAAIGFFGYHMPEIAQIPFHQLGNPVPFHPALRATVYFPFVPIIVHLFGIIGAVVFGNVIFFVSLCLLYRVIRQTSSSSRQLWWAVLTYALNPAFIYETSLYAEVYLIFFSLLVVLGINRQNKRGFALACIAGFCSALTHELGLLVGIFGFRYIRLGRFGQFVAFAISVAGGWIAYIAYLGIHFGQPWVLFQAEKTWRRTWQFPGTALVREIQLPHRYPIQSLEIFMVILLSILVILQFSVTLRDDSILRNPLQPLNVTSIETGLYAAVYLIVCLSTYVPGDPLTSVTRLLTMVWPIYAMSWLPTRGQFRGRRIAIQSVIIFCFLLSGYTGTVLFTHGEFFQ